MTWTTILGIVVLGAAPILWAWHSRRTGTPDVRRPTVTDAAGRLSAVEVLDLRRPTAPDVAGRLSAAEALRRTKELRVNNAQWDAIWPALNPGDDPDVLELLIQIRGPHMFAPHVGLRVIEIGCRQAITSAATADVAEALRKAILGTERFVR